MGKRLLYCPMFLPLMGVPANHWRCALGATHGCVGVAHDEPGEAGEAFGAPEAPAQPEAVIRARMYSTWLMLNITAAAWSSSVSPAIHCAKCLSADSRARSSASWSHAFIQFRALYFFAPFVRCSAQRRYIGPSRTRR